MKLNRSASTLAAAARILEVVSGRSREELQLAVSPAGDLSAAPAACGLSDGEVVIEERLEGDSWGECWEYADANAVLDWIETRGIPAAM
jgi:hypothetical protein